VVLSDEERSVLAGWARRRKTSQALALRARIVMRCAEHGSTIGAVAEQLDVSRATVSKWRSRFLADRLDGLSDGPRPGRPRTITDDQIEQVITKTLESTPGEDTHWSTRSMAASTGMSQSAISRIWRAFGLKPHAVETWKLSTDPLFVDKVRDVVGLYLSPPENALVLAVDEKSQMQAIDRTAPILPILPTTPARMTHDHVRHGTTSLFAAFDIGSGSVIAQHYRQHRHQEFLRFLKLIDAAVPKDPAPGAGQLRDPQDPESEGMADPPPPVPPALHPHQQFLAEPHRALVRRTHQPQTPPPLPPTAASPNSKPTSVNGSTNGTPTPNPSSGPRPPTKSSTPSPPTAHELTTQDISL
jgi:transposase